MSARYYPANAVDRYLASMRLGFQNSINRSMAEGQEASNPKIEMLKVLDSVIRQIESDLAPSAQMIEITISEGTRELVVEPELEQFESSLGDVQ